MSMHEDQIKSEQFESKMDYYDYKLRNSVKSIRVIFVIAGLFNLLLLIPDLLIVQGISSIISITVLRVLFSGAAVMIAHQMHKIKTFKFFSLLMTAGEIFAIFIFYFVLSRYDEPDFLIQAMGMMTIIIIIFLIPNRWLNMLFVSLCGVAGFFFFSYFYSTYSSLEFLIAFVYLSLTIGLCAVSAWNVDKHRFNEFQTRRELERIGSIDYLTNTANRFKMEEEAKRWISFCQRQGFPLAVVFIDVDDLKTINDQYGHLVGDTVLSSLSNIIHNQLRSTDLLSRWGGDEFIILLPNILLDDAVRLTERVRDAIANNSLIIGETVTCSFGVAAMRANSTFESLINEADNLMYDSKMAGKNKVKRSE